MTGTRIARQRHEISASGKSLIQVYEQTEGAAIRSFLSLAVADIYMEEFEKRALDSARLSPKC